MVEMCCGLAQIRIKRSYWLDLRAFSVMLQFWLWTGFKSFESETVPAL